MHDADIAERGNDVGVDAEIGEGRFDGGCCLGGSGLGVDALGSQGLAFSVRLR
jgi:hypothetical protein